MRYSAVLLVVAGLLHIPVWLLDGGSWEGTVSWRKPILFGLSTGITLWSLSVVVKNLPPYTWDRIVSWLTVLSLVLEVGLITVQQWRGRASHFNQDTGLEQWIDGLMLLLISIAFVGLIYFAFRSFGRLDLDRDYALAYRSGMLFLLASCIIGFAISWHGYQQIERGLSPEMVGRAGVAKFPHGVAIHALQLLPLFVYAIRGLRIEIRIRVLLIQLLSIPFALQLVFAIYQTVNGLERFNLGDFGSQSLALATTVSLLVPLLLAIRYAGISSGRQTEKYRCQNG